MPRLRQPPKKEEQLQLKDDGPILHENESQEEPAFEVVEPKAKEEIVIKEEPKEDPALALQKQLDDLRKSEEIQRGQLVRERDEALKRAQERAVEVTKFQKEATQSQYDAISTALAAAQSESESAKRDIKQAITNADPDLQADAYERLATARANISKLEDGKFELEARVRAEKAAPKVEPQVQQQNTDPLGLDKSNLPDSAKTYLRSHPDLITDPRKNARLQAWHWDALDAGKEAFSKDYFEFIDEKREPKKVEVKEVKEEPQQRTNIVSAPVSREVPNGGGNRQSNGKITLTAEQKEFARIAGVTETEYAKQLIRLNEAKANGQYTGGQ